LHVALKAPCQAPLFVASRLIYYWQKDLVHWEQMLHDEVSVQAPPSQP
jgi:hypothetical protein